MTYGTPVMSENLPITGRNGIKKKNLFETSVLDSDRILFQQCKTMSSAKIFL